VIVLRTGGEVFFSYEVTVMIPPSYPNKFVLYTPSESAVSEHQTLKEATRIASYDSIITEWTRSEENIEPSAQYDCEGRLLCLSAF
jgi:hypothetical protein